MRWVADVVILIHRERSTIQIRDSLAVTVGHRHMQDDEARFGMKRRRRLRSEAEAGREARSCGQHGQSCEQRG